LAVLTTLAGFRRQITCVAPGAPAADVGDSETLVATGGRVAAHCLVIDAVIAEVLVVARGRHERGRVAFRHSFAIAAISRLDVFEGIRRLLVRCCGLTKPPDNEDDQYDQKTFRDHALGPARKRATSIVVLDG